MKKITIKIASLIFAVGLLSACNDSGFSGFTNMSIGGVSNKHAYIGASFSPAPSAPAGSRPLPENLIVHYSQNPGSLDVYLNGQPIGHYFTLNPKLAFVPFSEIKDFLRQGKNIVKVDPLRFGPVLTFVSDTKGPKITVEDVCLGLEEGCDANVISGEVLVKMRVTDLSQVAGVTLEGNAATLIDGQYVVVAAVSPDKIFNIVATDGNGYTSRPKYLQSGATIPKILRVRIGDEVIASMTPLINPEIGKTDLDRPGLRALGMTYDWLDAFDLGITTLQVRMEAMKIGQARLVDFKMLPGSRMYIHMEMFPDGDEVGVKVKIRTKTSFIKIPIWMSIENMLVQGTLQVYLVDGQFAVRFGNDFRLTMGHISGSFVAWIINIFNGILRPVMELVTKTLVESVINNSMDKIRISMAITNESGKRFDLVTQAQNLTTTKGEMYMDYSGSLEVIVRDERVKRSLGSYYVSGELPELLDDPSTEDDNLALTVSSNMMNQGLDALYNIGMTHITVTAADKKIYFGPNAVGNEIGSYGDMKIELIPASPGTLRFIDSDTSQAIVNYNDAELVISRKDAGVWKPLLVVNADITAGIIIKVQNEVFNVAIQGTPDLQINTVVNNSSFKISDTVVKFMLNLMLEFAIPVVANFSQDIVIPDIDVNEKNLDISVKVKDFSLRGKHLSFNMGIKTVITDTDTDTDTDTAECIMRCENEPLADFVCRTYNLCFDSPNACVTNVTQCEDESDREFVCRSRHEFCDKTDHEFACYRSGGEFCDETDREFACRTRNEFCDDN